MQRWSDQDTKAIAELRDKIGTDRLKSIPQFPEVVGDRKLLRFLRGHDYNISKVTELYINFLDWRQANNVDEIRQQIVHGGINHPSLFPNGKKILQLIPQIVLAHEVNDYFGCPLIIDQYCFSPSEVLEEITIEEYINFTIYSLEYRSIILEQLSEEVERKKLQEYKLQDTTYGTLVYSCVIRDLKGVGFEHLGLKGREIISAVIQVASNNYPELMRRCFIINAPFIFTGVWYFIQGLLAAKSVQKIMVLGAEYTSFIEPEIPKESLPEFLGGGAGIIGQKPFYFDTNDNDGLLAPSTITY
jgi:hypothetical protein